MENVRDAATQFLSNKRIAVTRVSRKTDIPPFSPHPAPPPDQEQEGHGYLAGPVRLPRERRPLNLLAQFLGVEAGVGLVWLARGHDTFQR